MSPRKLRKEISPVKDLPASSPIKFSIYSAPQTPRQRQDSERHNQEKTPKASSSIISAPKQLLRDSSNPDDKLKQEEKPKSEDNVSEDSSALPDSSTSNLSSHIEKLADLTYQTCQSSLSSMGQKDIRYPRH